jgi:hypothetical protein
LERNPYVILGIPFGAPWAAANAAFARKAQALKRDGGDLDQMTDLTWALQRISVAIREPAIAMELYRIPADPEAFETGDDGVLQKAAAREYLRYQLALRAATTALPRP